MPNKIIITKAFTYNLITKIPNIIPRMRVKEKKKRKKKHCCKIKKNKHAVFVKIETVRLVTGLECCYLVSTLLRNFLWQLTHVA